MEDDEDMSLHEGFYLFDEGGYGLGVFVQSIDAAQISQQLDKLIFLDVIILFLFPDLFQQKLSEFFLEEHLVQTDQNLKDVHNDFRLGEAEPDTVFNFEFFGQHFASVKFDEVVEFAVDDGELVGDELFEHEDVFVFVDVVESVDVGTQSPSDLPSVGLLHSQQTFVVGVQVLQFADVDEVL